MATIKVYDQEKQEVGSVELAPEVFEVEARPEILNLVVRAQLAAKRAGTHSAKTRAYVSGGGVKPWKQKGTGRARAGSNRSPVWRGGAIIFGPQPRDYSFKVNRKVRALALRMALSSRVAANDCLVVKEITLPEGKTRYFAKVAKALGLTKALVVAPELTEELDRSSRNLPNVTLTTPERLSVYEILKNNSKVRLIILFNAAIGAVSILVLFFLQAKLPKMGIDNVLFGPALFVMGLGAAVGAKAVEYVKPSRYRYIGLISLLCVTFAFAMAFSGSIILAVIGGFIGAFGDNYIEVRTDVMLNNMIPSKQRATLMSVNSFVFSVVMIILSPIFGALFML